MFPSKVINIKDSILWKLPDLVEAGYNSKTVFELYKNTSNLFTDINDFLLSLDVLYLLEVIDIKDERGTLEYVERNNM